MKKKHQIPKEHIQKRWHFSKFFVKSLSSPRKIRGSMYAMIFPESTTQFGS